VHNALLHQSPMRQSTQIQDNSKIFAAAESYKKNKYQEVSAAAYENAVTYPFVMTRFGGLGNDAKKLCAG